MTTGLLDWLGAKQRLECARREFERLECDPNASDEARSFADDEICEAERVLMEMPAPNGRALAWKLDRILAEQEDGCTSSWLVEHLTQTKADYRALLA